jgi:hypothetical protein
MNISEFDEKVIEIYEMMADRGSAETNDFWYTYFECIDAEDKTTLKDEVSSIFYEIGYDFDKYTHLKFPNGRVPSNNEEYLEFIKSYYNGKELESLGASAYTVSALRNGGYFNEAIDLIKESLF